MIFAVRSLSTDGSRPQYTRGDRVRFHVVGGGLVRARVIGVDRHARQGLPLGIGYRLTVLEASPSCGYQLGAEYTIRASCLEPDGNEPASVGVMRTFLLAYLREGGTSPLQGALVVRAVTPDEASAVALHTLTAELEADVRDRGELPEATVVIRSVTELPEATPNPAVMAALSW